MSTVTFKGNKVKLKGALPLVGEKSAAFELVGQDLAAVTLDSFKGKKKILNVFISLDTSVCSKSVHAFYEKAAKLPGVVVLNISCDLPFAATRFCKAEKMDHVITLSAFRSSFAKDYGLLIDEGALKGLTTRAVIVLSEDNKVLYTELVSEITSEPNYEAALKALKS